jgi:Tfp pilus assembly protein PilN
MIKVNLIFPEYISKLEQKTKNLQIIVLFSLAAFIILVISSLHIRKAVSTENLLKRKQAELAKLEDTVKKVKEIEKTKIELAAHLKALDSLLDKRFDYPFFMQDAAKTIANTIKFRSFRTSSDEYGVIEFDITAQAYKGDDIGKWIEYLEKDDKFDGITLGAVGVERDARTNKEVFMFPVLGTYYARPESKPQEEIALEAPKENK